ncbi:AraC family transcriptional regulator [Synechococcus sp. Nb3U1]|uniref:helix-turn-helix domain-containing protein n=1 Tax=Synechococcus sp. Nb3U1 TaxID=1914529 RepID=UPI001F1FB019|nr:AraC family transcriptional regulator [Synechococcus sp. Nb3U1]MCF2970025.1 AraC family transcriptional regulator [Synechococcus sp. Nb3U1]
MAPPTPSIPDLSSQVGLLYPHTPLLSSQGADWRGFHLVLAQQPPFSIPEYNPSFHTICVNYGNSVKVRSKLDGHTATIDSVPGDIGIYPADLWQEFEWYQEATYLDLFLEKTIFVRVGAELCEREEIELIPRLRRDFDPLIYQIAVALKTSLEIDGSATKLYADAMSTALAAHLISRYSSQKFKPKSTAKGLSDQKLRQVVAYIQEYLDRDLSLSELANLVQLSPYHFSRLFKQSTGMAPHKYHIQCRVEQAKQLLLQKHLPIAEIAYAVGFTSQGHLYHHFKRLTGVTPKEFLRQH